MHAKHPVTGWLRFGMRSPLWLYRAHLGWLLGERFLRLTHIGRKSGQLRHTVLEVVDHDPATDSYLVASGWGEKSDYAQAHPRTFQHLAKFMTGEASGATREACGRVAEAVPVVAFRPNKTGDALRSYMSGKLTA